MRVSFHSNKAGWKSEHNRFFDVWMTYKVLHYLPLQLTFHPDSLITIFLFPQQTDPE